MKVTNILWDTDEGDGIEQFYGLPDHVDVPADVDIADYLSDTYGFCVFSYDVEC